MTIVLDSHRTTTNERIWNRFSVPHSWYKGKDFKDLNSTVAKRGSVCNMVQISKGCLNEVIIISLQEVIKRPLKVIPVI